MWWRESWKQCWNRRCSGPPSCGRCGSLLLRRDPRPLFYNWPLQQQLCSGLNLFWPTAQPPAHHAQTELATFSDGKMLWPNLPNVAEWWRESRDDLDSAAAAPGRSCCEVMWTCVTCCVCTIPLYVFFYAFFTHHYRMSAVFWETKNRGWHAACEQPRGMGCHQTDHTV